VIDDAPDNAVSPSDRPVEFACGDLLVRVDLELPGVAWAISPVVERVLAIVNESGCAQGKEFEVETSLREALANAVRYGCEHNPGKMIQVSVACDQARGVLIVVRDPGPGFDPSQVPSPVEGECIFASHGRGIYLINQLMDHVEFGRGGTEIRMIKR
jgi:serine/threonine-protein kinase RsbW